MLKGLIDSLVSAEESTPEDIELAWREAFAGDDEKLLDAAAHVLRPTDKPEYRAPDHVHSFASDIFSVGVTLFEMATGAIPIPGRDAGTIEDPAKRELVSFALRDEPSERPTAGALFGEDPGAREGGRGRRVQQRRACGRRLGIHRTEGIRFAFRP